MTITIVIIVCLVLLGGLSFIIYHQWSERRVMKAREQQRLELTQNISHELKTPVASILGALETILLHPEMNAEQQHEFLERAYQQAGRLSNLVEDISMLNKLDLNTQLYDRLELELSSVVKNVVEDVSPRVEELGAKITYHVPDHISISGNYTLLYSICRNVVDNSLSHVGKGVQIHIECTGQAPSYIYFSVYDNGPGVPQECLPHLFERFYRVDKGRSRKLGGTGLGLSIVKHAVQFHGGTITALNREGGGLEFQFSLARHLGEKL